MRTLLLAATALVMLSGAAYAQTSNSGSNSTATNTSGSQSTAVSNPHVTVSGTTIGNGNSSSNSRSTSTSSSRSNSRSSAVGNTTNVTVNGGTGTTGTGVLGGDTTAGTTAAGTTTGTGTTTSSSSSTATDPNTNVNYSGSYTVRNTPEVIPPAVMGGNPCAVGASGGVAMPGFGLAMGATWADKACERRQQAALLFNMGEQKVALELMCQDDHIRDAMKVAARPCTADILAAAPVSQATTFLPAVIPVVAAAPAKPMAIATILPAAPKPEWCIRAKPDTEASKAYVAQMCGK